MIRKLHSIMFLIKAINCYVLLQHLDQCLEDEDFFDTLLYMKLDPFNYSLRVFQVGYGRTKCSVYIM